MSQESPPQAVEAALEQLAAGGPRVARDAADALESLTWGESLAAVAPVRAAAVPVVRPAAQVADHPGAQAARRRRARPPAGVGRTPRYAAICHAPATAAILETYECDDAAGLAAFREALAGSGIDPPGLPEFAWGTVMGLTEARALTSVAAALELAISSGVFRPGGRGWRSAQQRAAREHLTRRRAELDGESWLETIHAERVEDWARGHGTVRRDLVAPLLERLAGPVPVSADAAGVLAPLRWLLETAAEDGRR